MNKEIIQIQRHDTIMVTIAGNCEEIPDFKTRFKQEYNFPFDEIIMEYDKHTNTTRVVAKCHYYDPAVRIL